MTAHARGPLVIIGDVLLDRDIYGSATRLTPDGPAPVVDTTRSVERPGGAGLAAVLAARHSPDVILIAPVADDAAGERLRSMLEMETELVPVAAVGSTPEKARVRCDGQTLLRLDSGGPCQPVGRLPDRAVDAIERAGAVLVADYGGLTAAHPPVRAAIERAVGRCPVVWDPHPKGATPVPGVSLATPNAAEAAALAGPVADATGLGLVDAQATLLCRRWRCTAVAVTRGDSGVLMTYGDGAPLVIPTMAASGRDTCGAGDSFSVAATWALAEGRTVADAVFEATHAATAFVSAGGVAALARREANRLAARRARWSVDGQDVTDVVRRVRADGGTIVATGGCFDLLHAGHVAMLHQARTLGDCLIVLLNSDESMRRLKGPARPLVPMEDRRAVLQALSCVDAVVVFDEETPAQALDRLRPDLWVKGGDYAGRSLPEAPVVAGWGGRCVVLPYLEGRSTTQLMQTAAARANRNGHGKRLPGRDAGQPAGRRRRAAPDLAKEVGR